MLYRKKISFIFFNFFKIKKAQNGHTEIVKLLISYGADVNVTTNDTKTPPLFMACQV